MQKFLRFILECWATIANTLQIATYFNWTVAGMITVAATLAGYSAQIPWFWLLLCASVIFASTMYGISKFQEPKIDAIAVEFKKQERLQDKQNLKRQELETKATIDRPFNISDWVNHENYFVWVAACLWVNIKPFERIGSDSPAYPALQKIKGAISSGQIGSLGGSAAVTDRVSRVDLLKLANIHQETPRFLFQEDSSDRERFKKELKEKARSNREQLFKKGFDKATYQRNPTRQNAVLRLTQLRGEGVTIRNDAALVEDDNKLTAWLVSVNLWMNEVIDVIQKIDAADSEYFKTLDTVPPARVQVPVRIRNTNDAAGFVNTYNQHDLRLVRLDALLKKYGVAA